MGTVNKIDILYAKVLPGKESGKYNVASAWQTQESAGPAYTGKYHMAVTNLGGTVFENDIDGKKGVLEGVKLTPDDSYSLVVTALQEGNDVQAKIQILADTYHSVSGRYDGKMLELSWCAPNAQITMGECVITTDNGGTFAYKIPQFVRGTEIPLKERFIGENALLTVTLKPYIVNSSEGPEISVQLFNSKFIACENDGKKQLCYREQSTTETSVSLAIEGEVYKPDKKPEAPVVSGPLELSVSGPYILTVHTDQVLTREAYLDFVTKLYGIVTVRAMYRILELISRCALQNVEDMLYYYCGLQEDKRIADLRPGFILRVEQAMYMPNSQLKAPNAAGFIGMHTADYTVSLAEKDGFEYLEFDSFLNLMDEEIYSADGPAVASIPVAAGVIDLCAVRMRQPYYRIQYPQAMYSSDVEPDVYSGNHPLMIAAPGWEDVSMPVGQVRKVNAEAPENLSSPYILFRGRSALTDMITICVNGKEKKVPVGTTVGKLLAAVGISAAAQSGVVLYRKGPAGKEARISFSDILWEELPLFNGDRIEG